MASSEISEVPYSTSIDLESVDHMETIKIETDSLEIGHDPPVECVQEIVTAAESPLGDQIIYGEELIVTTEDVPQSEEIVGGVDDSIYDSIPVPTTPVTVDSNDALDHLDQTLSHGGNGRRRKVVRGKRKSDAVMILGPEEILPDAGSGKIAGKSSGSSWQQKQVSIKTLEGEFSVTMWASGTDDGKRVHWWTWLGMTRASVTVLDVFWLFVLILFGPPFLWWRTSFFFSHY